MKKSGSSPVGLYTMGVACLFLAVFFLMVVFGAQTYRSIVAGQTENNQDRALLSYLTTCVKSSDTEGAISVYEEDGITVLSIADGDSGYGLKIYQYEGSMVEEYGLLETPLDPHAAQAIGESAVFLVEQVADHTWAAVTDEGRVLFSARCGEAVKAMEAVADD